MRPASSNHGFYRSEKTLCFFIVESHGRTNKANFDVPVSLLNNPLNSRIYRLHEPENTRRSHAGLSDAEFQQVAPDRVLADQ